MRITEAGESRIFVGKVAEVLHRGFQLPLEIAKAVAVENQVRVIGHVAARCAEVDDALCPGRVHTERIDVRHHVVPDLLFLFGHHVVIDRAHVRGQLVDLRLRNGKTQIVLCLRQSDPEPAPRFEPAVRGK